VFCHLLGSRLFAYFGSVHAVDRFVYASVTAASLTVVVTLQENSHLAAAKNGQKLLKTAGKFKNWQN
jgi:hypothetical protein